MTSGLFCGKKHNLGELNNYYSLYLKLHRYAVEPQNPRLKVKYFCIKTTARAFKLGYSEFTLKTVFDALKSLICKVTTYL